MLLPVTISVGILELMWIWNDYLLPYLVLDITEYRTVPIHVQYLQGSYGSIDLGATLAVIVMSLIPMVVCPVAVFDRHVSAAPAKAQRRQGA